MKKLLFIAAAAVGMVAVADVESANTVGYTQVTIRPGLNLIGTSFLKVDTNGRPDIQATFSDCMGKAKTGATGADVADFIQIFDSAAKDYTQQFWFYADPENPDPDWDYKWLDLDWGIGDYVIPSANAFWYKSRGDVNFALTSSGAVAGEDIQVTIKPGLNLIVNPFPCALALNSTEVNWKEAGATTGATGADVADFIQIFDSAAKDYTQQFWFYADPENPDPDWDYKWLDLDWGICDFSIPANGGFWYKSRGDKDITLTFKCPLKK